MSAAPARVDVAIAGAGPAGAVAALNLAPLHRVLVIEPSVAAGPRIGESLPAAARRSLAAMGLWERFVADGHAPGYGNRAAWGSDVVHELDFLRDPDGCGWHLDRARFDAWLRAEAIARGAHIIAARVATIAPAPDGCGWVLTIVDGAGPRTLHARAVVDATGRASAIARRLGARRAVDDRLVSGWLHARDREPGGGWTELAAEPDGWWYTAPLPDGRRVLAFQTDADLPAARDARSRASLLARAAGVPVIAARVAALDVRATGAADAIDAAGFVAAHGAALEPAAGESWCAVGDAALAFDPLSSQGLLNALFTGLAGAEGIDRCLAGDRDGLRDYQYALAGIRAAYLDHRVQWYREEARWRDRAFWARRHGGER